jgi:hypothetical protein
MADDTLVVHHKIVDGRLDYSSPPIVEKVSDNRAAVEYFRKVIQPDAKALLRNYVSDFRRRHGLAPLADTELSPSVLLAPTLSERQLLIDVPWQIRFHSDANFSGDDFTLGVLHNPSLIALAHPLLNTCDWDSNLSFRTGPGLNPNGSFNDCISSVECLGPDKHWVLCEDSNFRGRHLFGYGNVNDLAPVGFNDITSSIVMCSIPGFVITEAVLTWLGGG